MQKKGLKYLLIALVVLIWGLVIYRVVQGMGGDTPTGVAVRQPEKLKPVVVVDTFSLMANYPDPFVDQPDSVVDEPNPAKDPHRFPPGTLASPVGMPQGFNGPVFNISDLLYVGFIGNSSTRKRTAIIRYKGAEYTVKEMDKIEGIKILKIAAGAIQVSFDGERHTVNMDR